MKQEAALLGTSGLNCGTIDVNGMGFEVIAIGCDREERSILDHELAVLGIRVRAVFGDVRSAIIAGRAGRSRKTAEPDSRTGMDPILFVMPLRSCRDLDEVRRLVDAGTGRPVLGIVEAETDPEFTPALGDLWRDELAPAISYIKAGY